MKTTAFLALSALTIGVFSAPHSYAHDSNEPHDEAVEEEVLSLEEARALIMEAAEADDAVSGIVPDTKLKKYYDIRARQLAYREGVKEFRASLEARRGSFSAPEFAAIENYRDVIAKAYDAENAVAELARAEADAEVDGHDVPKKDYSKEKPAIMDDDIALADDASDTEEQDTGLTEKPIPSDPEAEEDEPKKKVVTSDDAPDFDPSDL